jgi:hypothetical protein
MLKEIKHVILDRVTNREASIEKEKSTNKKINQNR